MANLPVNSVISENDVFDTYNNNSSITATTNEYDAVSGFFMKKTNDDVALSASLTDTVIDIATTTGNSPMVIIDELAEYAIDEIQQTIISLINQTRNNTSILGFNKNQTPNNLVARNILS